MDDALQNRGPHRRRVSGRLSLFGHDATTATVEVIERGRRWRTIRALKALALATLIAFPVALIPPHAPWLIGALAAGAVVAKRRLGERRTLVALDGVCPRCAAPVHGSAPSRLRDPHPVSCEHCHHELILRVAARDGLNATRPPS